VTCGVVTHDNGSLTMRGGIGPLSRQNHAMELFCRQVIIVPSYEAFDLLRRRSRFMNAARKSTGVFEACRCGRSSVVTEYVKAARMRACSDGTTKYKKMRVLIMQANKD
jgi:hypothetical protein